MRAIVVTLMLSLGMSPLAQAQAPDESEAWRKVAAVTPLGSRVKVETADKRRYTGTLMQVTDTGILVKKATRLPEPPVTIAFERIARLEQDRGGLSVAKAVGVGIAAGAAAVLTLIVMAFTIGD